MPCCAPTSSSVSPSVAIEPPILALLAHHPDRLVVFTGANRPIRPNYHITEVRVNTVTARDCGHLPTSRQEIVLQLLDIPDSNNPPLTCGKLIAILRHALPAASVQSTAEIIIELSDGIEPIHLYTVAMVTTVDDQLVVRLSPRPAVCQAAGRWGGGPALQNQGCC